MEQAAKNDYLLQEQAAKMTTYSKRPPHGDYLLQKWNLKAHPKEFWKVEYNVKRENPHFNYSVVNILKIIVYHLKLYIATRWTLCSRIIITGKPDIHLA